MSSPLGHSVPPTNAAAVPAAVSTAGSQSVLGGRAILVANAQSPESQRYVTRLADHGAHVVVHGAAGAKAPVEDGYAGAGDGSITALDPHELRSLGSASEVIAAASAIHGHLDAVLETGAIAEPDTAEDPEPELGSLDRLLLPSVWMLQAAAQTLGPQPDHPRIVAVVPSSGAHAEPGRSCDALVGGALLNQVRALAAAHSSTSLKINALASLVLDQRTGPLFAHRPWIRPEGFSPEEVFPAVGYLLSPLAAVHGETLTAGAGRIARVVQQSSVGLLLPRPEIEDLAENLETIRSLEYAIEYRDLYGELNLIEV